MVKTKWILLLQESVNTDDQWSRMLQKEGLIVVDIYSEWCGHCVAMKSTLMRLKRKLIDYRFHLAIAKADDITYLKQFRDRSEPTWMLIIDGSVVNVMYGANAPKLKHLITEELKKEVAVKAGMRERIELDISNLYKEEEKSETVSDDVKPTVIAKKRDVIKPEEDFIYRPF